MSLAASIAKIDRLGALGVLLVIISTVIGTLGNHSVTASMVGYAFLLTGTVLVASTVLRVCEDKSIRVATKIGVIALSSPLVYFLVTI